MSEKSGWGVGKCIGCGCGGCLLAVVALVAFVSAVGGLAFFGMKKAEPYQEALRRAQENPAVIAVLGEPVEEGFLMSGSISVDGSSGEADLAFPISGPQGSGTVYVIGEKRAGLWEYSTMEVEIDTTASASTFSRPSLNPQSRTRSFGHDL